MEKGSPDWSALFRDRGSAAPVPSPGLQSPQVAEGRGGGVTTVTRLPLQENAVSRALHQPRGGGSAADRFPAQWPGLRPAVKPREPERGGVPALAFGDEPSLLHSGPPRLHPGRSGDITLKPPSCHRGRELRLWRLPAWRPPESLRGTGGGTHVFWRGGQSLLGLGLQLFDALRLGAGSHCGAGAGVLAHGTGCGARPGAPG